MFMFDIETLGVESNSVILSMACIHFDPTNKQTHQQIRDGAFFAKFDVQDQVHRLGRKIDKDTVEWWKKQCENTRIKSFKPSPNDVQYEVGCEAMREWVNSKNDKNSWVWARGSLDQVVFDSITKQCGLDPIFHFSRWRDVRTAVDFMYNTKDGYCKVETPPWEETFDPFLHITKHNPIDDCVYDIMMLLYGVPNEKVD